MLIKSCKMSNLSSHVLLFLHLLPFLNCILNHGCESYHLSDQNHTEILYRK